MQIDNQPKCNFTLVEVIVASSIIGIIMAAVMPFMIFALTTQDRMRKQADIDQTAWIAREWIKHDTRGTARDDITMWPSGASNALAVSFPVIRRDQSETSTPLDSEESIDWTHTIIYHLHYNNNAGKIELRRTVFTPRNNGLTTAQREKQLEDTLVAGNGSATYNGDNSNTATLLYNLKDFRIASGLSEIDCYSPERNRAAHSMGTWILDSGYHNFKFTCTGKNADSLNYHLGLDAIQASATDTAYDVESLLPAELSSGATPELESMESYTDWHNNAQMLFPANSEDDSVTFKIHNDMWLESSFAEEGADFDKTRTTFDRDIGENICQLAGNRTVWEAEIQTLGAPAETGGEDYTNATVRTVIAGDDPVIGGHIADSGRMGRLQFRADPAGDELEIESAYIMERTGDYNGDENTAVQLSFSADETTGNIEIYNGGESVKMEEGGIVTTEEFDLPIDKNKDYLVSFHITDDSGAASPAVWEDSTGLDHSYMIPEDENNVSGIGDWDSLTGVTVTSHPVAVSVAELYVTHPETGIYTSRIIDTKLENPDYSSANWKAETSSDTWIEILVRSGDEEDLSDAVDWESAHRFDDPEASNSLSAMTTGRYVQWRALLHTDDPYTETPRLQNVNILWPGRKRGIDIGLGVEKASDMGKLKLTIDDKEPSPAALRFSFTTARETHEGEIRKSFAVDAKPRNN